MRKQKPRTDDEWMSLIMECRRSGLSDKAWCEANGIVASTFYNAITRLRKKASIPEATGHRVMDLTNQRQDVVPIDIIQEEPADRIESAVPISYPVQSEVRSSATANLDNLYTIELRIGNSYLRLSNDADPHFLKQVLHVMRDMEC